MFAACHQTGSVGQQHCQSPVGQLNLGRHPAALPRSLQHRHSRLASGHHTHNSAMIATHQLGICDPDRTYQHRQDWRFHAVFGDVASIRTSTRRTRPGQSQLEHPAGMFGWPTLEYHVHACSRLQTCTQQSPNPSATPTSCGMCQRSPPPCRHSSSRRSDRCVVMATAVTAPPAQSVRCRRSSDGLLTTQLLCTHQALPCDVAIHDTDICRGENGA